MKVDRGRSSLTREGLAVLTLCCLVALAAANTGANLLFLILGLLLGTLVVSFAGGRRALDSLVVTLELPRLVESGQPVSGLLTLATAGDGKVARSVRLEASVLFPERGVYVERLAPGEGLCLAFQALAPARGVVRAVEVVLSTRAPFHLVSRSQRLVVATEVHVYPKLRPARPPAPGRLLPGGHPFAPAGEGTDLRNLRPYTAGDNPRHIHWRASARAGELVLREFHAEIRPEVVVLVDTSGETGARFEAAVAEAASRVRDALAGERSVDLRTPGERARYSGRQDLERALRFFSRIGPRASDAAPGWEGSSLVPGQVRRRVGEGASG